MTARWLIGGVIVVNCLYALRMRMLTVAVALYNRPRFIVPPHLREFPGALDELKGAEVPQAGSP